MDWVDVLVGGLLGAMAGEATRLAVRRFGLDQMAPRPHKIRIRGFSAHPQYGTLLLVLENASDEPRTIDWALAESRGPRGGFASYQLQWQDLQGGFPSREKFVTPEIFPGEMRTFVLHEPNLSKGLGARSRVTVRLHLDNGTLLRKSMRLGKRELGPKAYPCMVMIDESQGLVSVPSFPPTNFYGRVDKKP